ncbi:sulfatase, partial [Candidatus Poribacteria bacterium]|nr:sulfatase [Candidatus Poribacteria bacterium]
MSKKPNLLFFGVDSLRADHMSLYGYHRLTTPHIANMASEGTMFEYCFSPSIPTTPGYSSMLTGLDCFSTT